MGTTAMEQTWVELKIHNRTVAYFTPKGSGLAWPGMLKVACKANYNCKPVITHRKEHHLMIIQNIAYVIFFLAFTKTLQKKQQRRYNSDCTHN